MKQFFCCLILAAVFVLDLTLKAYVHNDLSSGGIGVLRNWHGIDFSLVHMINKGAAWGIFSSWQHLLLYVRILIIGCLVGYLFFCKASPFRKFCLALIATGAIGNVIDYFIYGHVVDMFYFIFWGFSYPVFNIADSAIFCGIALLLIHSWIQKFRKPSYKMAS